MRHPARRAAVALTALVFVVAAAPAASAEQIPGPPTRPGEEPIGGARLTGSGLVWAPRTAGVPAPPPSAAAWVLADAATGEVLAAKAPHVRYRPASTLKTLTALTLMPRLDPKAVHTATDSDARADGSRVGLVPGSTYTVDQLWHALLLPSANDAAEALAAANGGRKRTLNQMNAMAKHLQALDTSARTPSGLDENGQFTSAYDLALFARAALAMPQFVEISGTTSFAFPDRVPKKAGAKRATYQIYGQNRLLNHGFAGTVAGKTGYTTEAGRTFWVAVKRHGRTLIATFLRITEGTETTAKALMTWGFAHADQLDPVGTLVDADPDAPAPAGAAAGGNSAGQADAQGAAAQQAVQGGGLPLWQWLLVVLAVVGVALVLLRRRALARERARNQARASRIRGAGAAMR